MTPQVTAVLATLALAPALGAQAPVPSSPRGTRAFSLDDVLRVRNVRDPEISPDGAWVAYTVSQADTADDRDRSAVWMTSWAGTETVRLTTSKQGENTPRWSPDGRWLAFLSGRDDEHTQLWLLDRQGGEGRKLTTLKSDVDDYMWSPDGKRLVLVAADADTTTHKTPPPIVINRFQFKQDEEGYLGKERRHLYVLDAASGTTTALTSGGYDELLPAWSPDGKSLAFVSKRRPDFDRDANWDVYVMDATPGATPRQLTTFEGPDNDPETESRPAWSPDGRSIAYLQGGPLKLIYYAVQQLAVVPAAGGGGGGGAPRILTAGLDRNVTHPVWSRDGSSLYFLLEDDRAVALARVPASGGSIERLLSGPRVVSAFATNADGKIAVLASTPATPAEVFALEGTAMRPLSHQNDQWLAQLKLGAVDPITFKSRDGTSINGFTVKPPDFVPGKRYPTVLRIHGGPVSQFQYEFDFQLQTLAGHGYLVVVANPRGSSGRGEKFATVIYADWGNKDAQDVLAAIDYVVAQGLADPARLGVGGWSYGGILTNYVIAQDHRFTAAVSGASASNILAGYGTDQYVREYEIELGVPWKAADTWERLSFPFLHADRITTPTLFLCGDKDFNVPLLNSEQMYQALRSLRVETELVIYPGQHHAITKPSYRRDRLERYLAWYGKYLKP
ncbi:MAG: peptidase S9 family protein [Gemmatimonadetes bacterium]|nr:MAG: peptidase S9 family protein [Gemmatimonadota bacterium]